MISVVLPCYNGRRYLDEALQSVLAQTYRDFELLVVDDGSTDDSPEIAGRYAAADARVRVIRGGRGGISAALNRGIAEARFPWIARMDGDDVALPTRFERQMAAAAADPGVVAWGTYARHFGPDGRVLGVSRTGPTTRDEFARLRAAGEDVYLIHPTTLLRRDVVLRVGGYDGTFDNCEDLELFDRMAEAGPMLAIPEPLLLYRVHPASVSMTRFFNMRRLAGFVQARQRARLAGQALTLDQYTAAQAAEPAYRRAGQYLKAWSGFYYRRAGMCFAGRQRVRACCYFSVAAMLSPGYSLPRVWNQVLSGKARKLMNGTRAGGPVLPSAS